MTANQKTADHKPQVLFLVQSEREREKKKQNLVFENMIRQVNVPASKYRKGGYDCRLLNIQVNIVRVKLTTCKSVKFEESLDERILTYQMTKYVVEVWPNI